MGQGRSSSKSVTRSDRPTSPLGGDQDGLALVALAEDLEEQFCSSPGKWNQTQFVDDQQAEARQIPPEVEQSFFIPWLQRSALPRLHRYDAQSWFPSQGGYLETRTETAILPKPSFS